MHTIWKKIRSIVANAIEIIFPKSREERLLETLGPEKVCDMIPCADMSPDDLVPAARSAHAVWPYRHPLAESLIHLIKSSGSRAAAECAGIAAWRYIEKHILPVLPMVPEINTKMENGYSAAKRDMPSLILILILIPIPLSPRRQRERGYNQSEWIAEAIVRYGKLKTNIEVRTDILERTTHTARQALKNKTERQQTADKQIFKARLRDGSPQSLKIQTTYIIIDDVITTGSTLVSAREALVAAGAKDMQMLAVAH